MRTWTKSLLLFMTVISVIFRPETALADTSYNTFTFDSTGRIMMTQTSYLPTGVIDGDNVPGNEPFSSPQDIFIDGKDNIYVADTGNSRVVEFDKYGHYLKIVGQHILSQPSGVYVDRMGSLFVADSGNNCVYKFNQTGLLVHTYQKPTSPLFDGQQFVPQKVVTDNEGNLFIVSDGSVQGLIELSPQGTFEGYFGGNKAGFSLSRYLQRMFYTQSQLSQLQTVLPSSPTNVAIDNEGLIYTATSGLQSQGIKRLNVSGDDLLAPSNMQTSSAIADIALDQMGDIYAVDSIGGEVFEYDSDGRLLSAFGGSDTGNERMGLFKSPSGVAVSSDNHVFVLDKERGNIQIFRPTEFTQLEHKAIALYLDGKYMQSIAPWTQVLRLNSMLGLAHVGIGMADFKKGDYSDALAEFSLANDKTDYSNAYWEIRREWLLNNLSKVLIGIVLFFLCVSITKRLYRRYRLGQGVVTQWKKLRNVRIVAELWHAFRVMRHPIDGFYELRMEGKVSILSATVLLGLYFLVHLIAIFQTNFLFNQTDTNTVSLSSQIYQAFVPLFTWMVVNYLVSTINDGEGRFRDVYTGTIYAMSPYIVLAVPIAIMSQGLTDMELVVYNLARNGMILWSALLMFCMVKEVHSYEIGETVRNILVTIVGMVIMALLAFILFGLSNQVIDFVHSVSEEVMLRVGQ